MLRAVVAGIQAKRFGRIIHIDSEVARRPSPPGWPAHAAAKSAHIGSARNRTGELARFGITVNGPRPK